jgi:hypothetical protein
MNYILLISLTGVAIDNTLPTTPDGTLVGMTTRLGKYVPAFVEKAVRNLKSRCRTAFLRCFHAVPQVNGWLRISWLVSVNSVFHLECAL